MTISFLSHPGVVRTSLVKNLKGCWEFNSRYSPFPNLHTPVRDLTSGYIENQDSSVLKNRLCLKFIQPLSYAERSEAIISDFPLTICVWLKVNNTSQPNNVLHTNYYSSKHSGAWINFKASSVSMNFGNGGGSGLSYRKTYTKTTSYSAGTWYHVLMTASSISSCKLYVNATELTSLTETGDAVSVDWSGGKFRIGTGDWYGMWYDQPAVWSRELSLTEIQMLYNNGAGRMYRTW